MTTTTPSPPYVTELSDSDVLFGRGSGPNDHPGNVKFREYVAARKVAYMATSHRLTKTNLAKEILDLVSANGGRFLRKVENVTPEIAAGAAVVDVYEIVDDNTIMEKAKQALRQNANKTKESIQQQQHQSSLPAVPQVADFDLEPIPFTSAGYSGPPPTGRPQQQTVYDLTGGATMPANMSSIGSYESQQTNKVSLGSYESQQQQQQRPMHSAYGSVAASPHHPQQQPTLISFEYTQQQQLTDNDLLGYGDLQPQRSVFQAAQSPAPKRTIANKRASLTIEDLEDFNPQRMYQRQNQQNNNHRTRDNSNNNTTTDMDELSTSFSNMRTVTEQEGTNHSRSMLMASNETMGTIDALGSIADMSITSSTLAIFNRPGSNSVAADPHQTAQLRQHYTQSEVTNQTLGSPTTTETTMVHSGTTTISSRSQPSAAKSKVSRQSEESTNSSMSFEGFESSKNKSSNFFDGALSLVREQVDLEYPRSVAIPEESTGDVDPFVPLMGQSSLDVMKVLAEDEDSQQHIMPPPPPANDQRQQYYQQDPK